MSTVYLADCALEIFLSLESHHNLLRQHMSEVRLSIPAVKSAIFLTLDNLNLPRALLSKKITLGTFPQTITLALRLLDSFVPKRAFHSHTSIKDPTLHKTWLGSSMELNVYGELPIDGRAPQWMILKSSHAFVCNLRPVYISIAPLNLIFLVSYRHNRVWHVPGFRSVTI